MSISNEWNIKIGFSFSLAMLVKNILIAIYLRFYIVSLLGAFFEAEQSFCFDFFLHF